MNYELWSQCSNCRAYKILYRRLFFVRVLKTSSSKYYKKLKPLSTQPQVECWFPVVNDKTVPIGVLGQIHAEFDTDQYAILSIQE